MYETSGADYTQAEFDPEVDAFEEEGIFEKSETDVEGDYEEEVPLDETDEMALAAELLDIQSEEELDQFLGNVFKKVWKGVKKIGKPLGRVLKGVAKVALPIAGKVAGGFFGGPAGAMIGGQLGSAASKIFGAEVEGLSPEDQSFEVARRFVRLAASAARRAGRAPAGANLNAAAMKAVRGAARRHAPGLLRGRWRRPRRPLGPAIMTTDYPQPAPPGEQPDEGTRGEWVRKGRDIVILNCCY